MKRKASEPVDLDDRVVQTFWNHARYFIERLGEPKRESNEFCFPVQDLPFNRFTIRCEVEKKFLGKIYVMVLEGCCPAPDHRGPGDAMALRYGGFFKKKDPFFVPLLPGSETIQGRGLSQALNGDATLLDACHKLEIESLKVAADPEEGVWKIQVRPFGGSYIHLIFPPMRYPVLLPPGQGELLFSVMHQVARHLVPSEA